MSFFDYPTAEAETSPPTQVLLPDATEAEWTTLLEFTQARRFGAGQSVLEVGGGGGGGSLYLLLEGTFEVVTPSTRFGRNTRMACCARVKAGPVKVALSPEPGEPAGAGQRPATFDRSILSAVVIGNGIAGVTAADFLRRGHPDCEIHLVGRETHVLYNRMGISRLVYGRSAMQGLYLLAEPWYDDHGITAWLNTFATDIDLAARRVRLGTGSSWLWAAQAPCPRSRGRNAGVLRDAGSRRRDGDPQLHSAARGQDRGGIQRRAARPRGRLRARRARLET